MDSGLVKDATNLLGVIKMLNTKLIDFLCGKNAQDMTITVWENGEKQYIDKVTGNLLQEHEVKGFIQLAWETFGGFDSSFCSHAFRS